MICAYGDDIHADAWWYAKPAAWIKKEVTFGRQKLLLFWRRVRDSNPRFLSESPVFKTGSLNRSDNSPFDEMISFRHEIVKVFPVLAIQSFEWSALDGKFLSLWCFSKLLGGYAVCREKQSALRIKVSYSHIAIAPSLDVAQNFVIWYSVSSLQRITAEAL